MQSGMALWPGSTTLCAERITAGSDVTDDVTVGRYVGQGLRDRAQVAHAVVNDRDALHLRRQKSEDGGQKLEGERTAKCHRDGIADLRPSDF